MTLHVPRSAFVGAAALFAWVGQAMEPTRILIPETATSAVRIGFPEAFDGDCDACAIRSEGDDLVLAGRNGRSVHVFHGDDHEGVSKPVAQCEAFSFAAWVKPESFRAGNPYPRLFQLGGFYLHLTESYFRPGIGIVAGMAGLEKSKASPSGVSSWESDLTIPFRRWTHVAIVVEPSASCRPKLFLNGRASEFGGIPQPLPSPFPADLLTVGNVKPGGNRPFAGLMADPKWAPVPFSSEQIARLAEKDPDGNVPPELKQTFDDKLPIVDIADDREKHVIVAAGTEDVYQGHPTTVVADDGTIFCVWTIGHGGKCGPMARSCDDGLTWERCDDIMPPEYSTYGNCPTLQRIPRKDGGANLAVFSCAPGGCGIVISEDNGRTWKTAPVARVSAGMPPTGLMPLKDGSVAAFGQVRNSATVQSDRPSDDQSVWMSVSTDGGWTWGPMRIVATVPEKNLCEPHAIRSPDGLEIALLIRENRHHGCSMMCFSKDEGKTWSTPVDTCWGLSGDRHEAAYLPDGRLLVAFRDRAIGASTYGQYMGWVGSYDDLRNARPGDFRVHLLHHRGVGGFGACDTGYSGVEVLKDGTIVCTTYMRYWADARKSSVVMTRFRMSELDITKKNGN